MNTHMQKKIYNNYTLNSSTFDYPMLHYFSKADGDFYIETNIQQTEKKSQVVAGKIDYKNIQEILIEYFEKLPAIEDIYLFEKEKDTQIWILIPRDNNSLRDKIYDIEYKIIKKYSFLSLDFHIVVVYGKKRESIIPSKALKMSIRE